MDNYKVLPFQGKSNKYALYKEGNAKATRIYKDGLEMRGDVAFYLFNRDCKVELFDKDGKVRQTIVSCNGSL